MKLLIENGADTDFLNDIRLHNSDIIDILHWLEDNNVNMISFVTKKQSLRAETMDW